MSFVNITGSLIAIALIRTRPTSPEARRNPGPIINTSVISHSEFWSIATSLIVAVVGYAGPFYFITQYMTLQFPNLPADSLATTTPLMILSFAVCAGRGLVGLCSDYLGAVNTYILVFISSGVVQLSLWLTVGSYAHACVFAAMYGLVAPGYLGLIPQIVVTLFGPTSLASNVGVLLLFNGPGNLVSGPLGGALFDMTHGTTWKWMIVVFGSLQILGGLTACWGELWRYVAHSSEVQDQPPAVVEDLGRYIRACIHVCTNSTYRTVDFAMCTVQYILYFCTSRTVSSIASHSQCQSLSFHLHLTIR